MRGAWYFPTTPDTSWLVYVIQGHTYGYHHINFIYCATYKFNILRNIYCVMNIHKIISERCREVAHPACHWGSSSWHKFNLTNPTMHLPISHNAPFVTEMCTHVHISVTKWCIVVYLSCGILPWPPPMMASSNGNTSALLALCAGNSPVIGEFPSQRPVTRSFDVFFDLHLMYGWVNIHEAGALTHHRTLYDITVMSRESKNRTWKVYRVKHFGCGVCIRMMMIMVIDNDDDGDDDDDDDWRWWWW